ncbi:hypothetical protein PGT21_021212 [Puccinia graminis f. sp. tritici]|uniref:Ketopantoate reductase C-terminal domain-containing protein n=1 Tax=Puccinia graminis f. sp. tritici TaxID=56615 RepID=A0A5B0LMA9_PUCGR|nr:hypothetical protein PGT21_021212 [Puccinia graminis f. sp. tritici]KAA1136829.1 hypothetical protein PGTUg99_002429 [Puccinia graminis f. sp. tritici]
MSQEPIDVLLVGLGAVGGIYAYVLEKSQRCRVTAITRSLYNSIQTHGLTINSEKYGQTKHWKPYRLVRSAQEAVDRNYRFIICCVKCLPDVEPTSSILAPFLLPSHQQKLASTHPPPTVVLIQNGIGIEQSLAEAFPLIHIISCVAWIGANMISPPPAPEKLSNPQLQPKSIGPIIEHGPQDRLVFGLYEGEGFAQNYISQPHDSNPGPCNRYVEGLLAEDGSPLTGTARDSKLQNGKEEVKLFLEIMTAGGCEAEALDYIQPARWAKNLWNGAFSTMCTLSRASVAQLTAPEVLPYTLPAVRRTMLEILYVGRALGYREAEFPAKLVDEAISFTIQHYQAKGPKDPKTQESKPQSQPSHSDQKLSSQSATTDVFEDDDDEEEEEKEVDELKKSGAPPKPAFKPSMLIDVEMNRPMELEPIVGAVLDRARSKAIETPRLDLLYSVLKVLQEQAVSQHAAKLKTQQEEQHLHHWAMRKPSIGGSGTSDSRQAWLDEVQRRARLGDQSEPNNPHNNNHHHHHHSALMTPIKPSIERKVTGKPLA